MERTPSLTKIAMVVEYPVKTLTKEKTVGVWNTGFYETAGGELEAGQRGSLPHRLNKRREGRPL